VPDDRPADEPIVCPSCGALLPREAITDRPGRLADLRYSDDAAPDEPDTPLTGFRVRDITIPSAAMCSARAVGIAAFLCGPLAGVLLMMSNDFCTGRRRRGWLILLLGTLASVVLVLALIRISESDTLPIMGRLGIAVADGVLMALVAFALQGRTYQDHINRGGPTASGGRVVGLSIIGMILFLGLAGGIGIAYEDLMADKELTVGPNKKVFYSRQVSEADARRLGKVLMEIGSFSGNQEQGARLDREGEVWVVTFWVRAALVDAELAALQAEAREISVKAFDGKPVRVELRGEVDNKIKETANSTDP
jgi:hypothetical protein